MTHANTNLAFVPFVVTSITIVLGFAQNAILLFQISLDLKNFYIRYENDSNLIGMHL